MRTLPAETEAPAIGCRWAPIAALLLLSPVIGEVLFGATRITTLFVLLPQVGTWGCASLLIREVVRRRRGGWGAILLLGMALAVLEECLIQQTSFAPLVGADPKHPYGRAFGVNWVYFLWALGYESIWVVALPIQLTELIFPARRDQPWLRARGLVISIGVFLFASFVAWYSWTQLYVPRFFPELAYRIPWSSVVIALVAIVALAVTALGLEHPSRLEPASPRAAPRPWLVGLAALALALPWFGLVFVAYGAWVTLPWAIPMALALALAGAAFSLFDRWSRAAAWQDPSCLALVFGALSASMLAGFLVLKLGGAPRIDVVGKLVLNIIAVVLLIRLARAVPLRSGRT